MFYSMGNGSICSRLEPTGSKIQVPTREQRPLPPVEDSSAPPSPTTPVPVNEPRPGRSINAPALRCTAFAPQPPERKDTRTVWELGRLFEGRQPLLALVGPAEQIHTHVCCCQNNPTH